MTERIVVDASVVLGWALGDAPFERVGRLFTALTKARALVPAIWQAEVANVLLVKERQRRIDAAFVGKVLRHLEDFDIDIDVAGATTAFDQALPIARRHQLSVYDAIYLDLAIREQAPLATLDGVLDAAATKESRSFFAPPAP
ncbi:MAG: type II toxin-antitoxin system VapC family toxin [Planctomycetota bacterium]